MLYQLSHLKKMIVALSLSSILALAILFLYLQFSLQRSAINQWTEHKHQAISRLARGIDKELDGARVRLEQVSRFREMTEAFDASLIDPDINGVPPEVDKARRLALDRLLDERDHHFNVLFLLLPNGDFYLTHPFAVQQKLNTRNLSHRPYFKQATQLKEQVISDVFMGADGIPAVAIDTPILNQQGEISAHLGGVFYLSQLTHMIDSESLDESQAVFLLDRNGKAIIERNITIEQEIGRLPFIADFISDPNGEPSANNNLVAQSGADTRMITLERLQNGWTLGVSTNMESIVRHFMPEIWRTSGLAAVLLAVISGLGIVFVSRVGRHWRLAEQQTEAARDQLEVNVAARTQELSLKEERLRITLNSIGDAVITSNTDGLVLSLNPVAELLTGWRENKAIGKNVFDIFRILNVETRERIDDPIKQVLETGDNIVQGQTTILLSSTGEEFQIALSAAPIYDDQADIVGAVLVFRDITEKARINKKMAENEARLRAILDYSPMLISTKDLDGKFTLTNRHFEIVKGYGDNNFVGKNIYDVYPEKIADVLRQNDLKARNGAIKVEEKIHHKDGSLHTYLSEKFPMTDQHGVLMGTGAISTDITQLKQSESALRRTQKMDAIGQLTGGIAHDFNNIMAIILGNVSLLKMQIDDDENILHRIETIEKSGQRAVDLTRQLLGFSRKQADKLLVTDLNSVINNMDSLIARSITPEIAVETSLEEDLWLCEIDPGDLEDALINLVINARDSMPEEGRLRIETKNCHIDPGDDQAFIDLDSMDYVQVAISDTGKGIPPKIQERIFEPFFTTKEKGKGTGLGLAMVYGFVNRANGVIKVESEAGAGTCFRIYLPRSEQSVSAEPEQEPLNDEILRGSETILVVDDEQSLRELAKDMLEAMGYQVLTAEDGQDALTMLRQRDDIRILFSDVVMPGGINGYQLAEKARTEQPQLRVLLTSGYTDRENQNQQKDNDVVLSKPYSRLELSYRIRALMS